MNTLTVGTPEEIAAAEAAEAEGWTEGEKAVTAAIVSGPNTGSREARWRLMFISP